MRIDGRITKIFYLCLAALLILGICYIFGFPLLEGFLKGNDTPYSLVNIQWVDKWFPKVPFWFPLQGGGASLASGYPLGAHILVVLLARLTPLDLVQAMRFLAFISVPLIALGIFTFVWYKFKNWLAACLAGAFYILSYASWSWLIDLGLYAQPISLIFVPWVFLFFDQFLIQRRVFSLFLGAIFFTLAGLFHFITAVVLLEALFFYAIFFGKNFLRALGSYFLFVATSLALSAFWLIPTVSYRMLLGSFGLISVEGLRHISTLVLLGIKGANTLDANSLNWSLYFAYPVTILAFAGMALTILRREKEKFFVGFLALIFILQTALPGIAPQLVKPFLVFFSIVQEKSILVTLIFFPIAASLGAILIADYLVFFIREERSKKRIVNALALILSLLLIFTFLGRVPPNSDKRLTIDYKGLGPDWGNNRGKFLWPPIISKQGISLEERMKEMVSKIGGDELTRIDVSPEMGFEMQAWNIFSQNSQVGIYAGLSGLSRAFLGYQREAFYKSETSSDKEVASLAQYFGIKYAVLNQTVESPERLTEKNWEDIYSQGHVLIKKFKKPEELITLTYKPTTLVIGKFEKNAYEQIFRMANGGVLSYNQSLLVEGDSENINDYTLEELNQFAVVLLYGYTYSDRIRAMKLLEEYVKGGGKLFIETGWQYVSPDWERVQTEVIFPVEKYSWTNFGKSWEIAGFSPPIYQEEPWGLGAASIQDLRSWAEPVITQGDKVLVARGSFGKGRVVWSGMNLFGHALMYKNEEEMKVLNEQISWLLEEAEGKEIGGVVVKRENPDRVEFSFTIPIEGLASLYFRESFHPYWQAKVQRTEDGRQKTERIPIYRAGPEYMLVRLPPLKTDVKVVFEIREPFVFSLAKLTSVLTLTFLLLWVVRPEIFSKLAIKVGSLPRPKVSLKDFWGEEK